MKNYLEETNNCIVCNKIFINGKKKYKNKTCSKKCSMIITGQKRREETKKQLYAIKNMCNTCNELIPYSHAFKKNKVGLNHKELICITKYKNKKTCNSLCQSLNQIFKTNNVNEEDKSKIIKYAKCSQKHFDTIQYITKKISNIKTRSRIKKLEFNLDIFYLLKIMTIRCPLTNKEFHFKTVNKNQKLILEDFMPTINRIDSNKGYIKGNVEWLSWKANRAMLDTDLDFIEKIINYKKQQKELIKINPKYLEVFCYVKF